jgi:pyruvate dehydrogenase E1 component alpha subunit
MELSKETQIKMYEDMLKIRAFEEQVDEFISRGAITGTTHLCIGQEAVAVGACYAIKQDDYIASTHRGHGHSIAKGAQIDKMMAELFGKETGYCKGRGGSLHIVDMSTNNLGANGIVGGGIPIAVGAALSVKMQKQDKVVVCFFGDGAMNQGAFHEAVNLASVWKLPVVFVCENNQYGMSTPLKEAFNIRDLSVRAKAYGIEGTTIDGNDLLEVYDTVKRFAEKARAGEGPNLIVAETYRWKGHSKSDARKYRTREEEQKWMEKDPIAAFEKKLIKEGILSEQKADQIKETVEKIIEDAVKYAQESPYPSVENITDYVYVEEEA